MKHRTSTTLLVLALAPGLIRCDDRALGPSAPTAPSPVPIPPSDPGYTLSNVTLSGVVFEMTPAGQVPIEGVAVYCEPCGAETHTWASTDSNGFYSFKGVWQDVGHFPTRISFTKDGYADPEGLPRPTPPNPPGPGWREVVVNGDTRFDVRLVRP